MPLFIPNNTSFDMVGVFDQDFNQVFRLARAIKAVVKEEAKLMEHPVESGATIVDHRVILPTEIQLSLLIQGDTNYQDTYKEIKQAFDNATLLIVQTKSGVYENQLIASLPHEEDPEQFDLLAIALSLRQVLFVTAQYGIVPRKPVDNTKVDAGAKQPEAPPKVTENTSAAADLIWGAKPKPNLLPSLTPH